MGGATLAAAIAGTTGGAGGVNDFTSGGGLVAIPAGATGVTIEVWGAGGGGGYGARSPEDLEPIEFPGGGGGGGAYARTVLVLTPGDAGKTFTYIVGLGGTPGTLGDFDGGDGTDSSAFAGSYALPAMLCLGGKGGKSGFAGGSQGNGGAATGGNTANINGNGGAAYFLLGASPIVGLDNLIAGGGGDGALPVSGGEDGRPGNNGRVRFVFTF